MRSILFLTLVWLPFAVAYIFRVDQHFERWVERIDWRRADRHLSLGATFALFSVVCLLGYVVTVAWATGAIGRAIQ